MHRPPPLAFALVALLAFSSAWGAVKFFPKDALSAAEERRYARQLSAMKEPALTVHEEEPGYFGFRLLFLPTWGRPMALRIERQGGIGTRRAVVLSSSGGKIYEEETAKLAPEEIATIVTNLKASGFWELPTRDDVTGFDGNQLVIEVIQEGKHIVFARWTPEHNAADRGLTGLIEFYRRLIEESGVGKKR
ncbi:MAG: hypothetical protein V4773_25400 [Verrucomicrobiota bacterium]